MSVSIKEVLEEYYYIRSDGEIGFSTIHDKTTFQMRIIGNYFETYEEVEKALEKLKALKRLKDKGFKFLNNKTIGEYGNVLYRLNFPITLIEDEDLDLLFGGEE